MKERPILFSAPMVRAILAGTKTQTRRIVKSQPTQTENAGLCWKGVAYGITTDRQPYVREFLKHCPYGAPGDRLWVREAFWRGRWTEEHFYNDPDGNSRSTVQWCHPAPGDTDSIAYVADGPAPTDRCERWEQKPSIHMPRWVSRITLDVTGVRVERLQDIEERDIIAEGCTVDVVAKATNTPWSSIPSLHHAWQTMWEHINGSDSWNANLFVWVVEFRRIEVPT